MYHREVPGQRYLEIVFSFHRTDQRLKTVLERLKIDVKEDCFSLKLNFNFKVEEALSEMLLDSPKNLQVQDSNLEDESHYGMLLKDNRKRGIILQFQRSLAQKRGLRRRPSSFHLLLHNFHKPN